LSCSFSVLSCIAAFLAAMTGVEFGYPIPVALAYLLFCAYLVNRIFIACRLPGAVGVILVGFAFSFFIQEEIRAARNVLQGLAFFLVLLTAGFEITLFDLNRNVFVMSFIPALVEMAGISLHAVFFLGFNWVQGAALAITLACIGDGLVIPRMKEFFKQFPGHPMPRLMFTWAPLEASLTLTLFGILEPLAHPQGTEPSSLEVTIAGNVIILGATFLGGCCLGNLCAKFVMHRSSFVVMGKHVFTGNTTEAYLIVVAAALFAFGCGHTGHHGEPWIPLPIASGSLFQSELLVIVTGSAFGACVSEKVLHGIEATMEGVWVFGQLVLFTMIGSKTELCIFCSLLQVIPIMFCGLACRFLGVFLAMAVVRKGLKRPPSAFLPDVIFCFTATLPRATLQGVLGNVPMSRRYFYGMRLGHEARLFIAVAGKIYIVVFSIIGSLLLGTVGTAMLQATADAGSADAVKEAQIWATWQTDSTSACAEIVPLPAEKQGDVEAPPPRGVGLDGHEAGG